MASIGVLAAWLSLAGVARADWPTFRGDAALSGYSGELLPNALALQWSFKTDGPVKSSPVIAAGKVFVGSSDGRVYALDLNTGAKAWAFKAGDAVEAPPLVFSNRVYAGCADFSLYALDRDSGKQLWRYQTDGKVMGAANVVVLPQSGRAAIVFGSYDNRLHCVDAESGALVWRCETTGYINGAPAVAGSNIVFGGCDALVHVVSTAGQSVREIQAGSYIPGSVATAGGRAYVGHFGNQVLCLDLGDGSVVWRFAVKEGQFFSTPAVDADHVVIGCRDKAVYCLSRKDGTQQWAFRARGSVDSSPVICRDKVVFGSDDGRFYVASLADGRELWSYDIGGPISSSPAVSNGIVVIGGEDGSVYAFGAAPTGAK